jgi:hypothetical protein
MNVAQLYDVRINDTDTANAGASEVQKHRHAQSASANDENGALDDVLLPPRSDLRNEQLPAVSDDLPILQSMGVG